jgi:hypothetical protein
MKIQRTTAISFESWFFSAVLPIWLARAKRVPSQAKPSVVATYLNITLKTAKGCFILLFCSLFSYSNSAMAFMSDCCAFTPP